VACDKFVLDRWTLKGSESAAELTIGGDERFHIISVLAGTATLSSGAAKEPLTLGQTLLLPASLGICRVAAEPSTVFLDSYLP
jgi:mannose-6-phosphate isomerase